MLMKITIPEFSLVLVVGSAACGTQDFIEQHFQPDEIFVYEGGNLFKELSQRLAEMRLTVIDMTEMDEERWRVIVQTAKRFYTQINAVLFDIAPHLCDSEDILFDEDARIQEAMAKVRRSRADATYFLTSLEQVRTVEVFRENLPPNHKAKTGPFDIVGDVHGCYDELVQLLERLGYEILETRVDEIIQRVEVVPPAGRTLVFVGDLVDRGPKIGEVLMLAMGMVNSGTALCVPGNHDDKLMRALKGRKVKIAHGLAESLEQIKAIPGDFHDRVREFFEGLPSHLMLDGGSLVVAHAGLRASMHGRNTDSVRDFALYGATTGKLDQYGLPVRLEWANDYHGAARVVYGHTPIPSHRWKNNTLNIDTGCVFGGALSALRYPELTLYSVKAKREYAVSARPFVVELDADLDSSQMG